MLVCTSLLTWGFCCYYLIFVTQFWQRSDMIFGLFCSVEWRVVDFKASILSFFFFSFLFYFVFLFLSLFLFPFLSIWLSFCLSLPSLLDCCFWMGAAALAVSCSTEHGKRERPCGLRGIQHGSGMTRNVLIKNRLKRCKRKMSAVFFPSSVCFCISDICFLFRLTGPGHRMM